MTQPPTIRATALQVAESTVPSTAQINQFLGRGRHRLVIVAPFGNRILVTPLNPVPGFQFLPDNDPTVEIWNSQIITPQDGQFSFLIKLASPLGSEVLQVVFVFEGPDPVPPIVPPPPSAPPPPAVPPPPPAAPPGDMQEFYRQQGYRIAGDGAVEFYWVALRTNLNSGQREICVNGNFAWGNAHSHDPRRALAGYPQAAGYSYSRLGPYPNRAGAEVVAVQLATTLFGDPTRFGLAGTGGVIEIPVGRPPAFL